ncbi:unnamed protein product [Linum tenue]|uniref:CRC domain-containing protein n=2 Tax=Linum tenue TaxID=586396 RepID=A0AAV0HFR0_9ROSI|nr:unnamed protein product [Linum tenue]
MMDELSTPDNKRQPDASSSSVSQLETSPFFNYINNLSPLELVKFRNKTGVGLQAFDSQNFRTPSPISTSEQLKFVNSSARCQGSVVARSSSKLRELPEFDITPQELECLASKNEVVKADVAAQEPPEGKLECISAERLSYDSKRNLRRITRSRGNKDEMEHDWVSVISELADVLTLDSLSILEKEEDPELKEQQKVLLNPMEESNFVSDVLQSPQEFDQMGENQKEDNVHGARSKELVVCDASVKTGLQQKQHKARRRCLIFEMAGSQKRKSRVDGTMSSSSSLDEKEEDTCLSRKGNVLHLRSLVTSSGVVKAQCLSNQKNTIVCITDLVESKQNVPESSIVPEWGDSSSPKRKRLKVVHIKKCNCKRSKCLKLYCECFAAGLYCMESCSCQGCSNNPANETAVLATRHLIFSRNPLAFEPKVMTRLGGEMNAATPASARHKKGCNCRKSHCLKKYCECFEGGVGCSPSCRCRECRNSFGSSNVPFLLEYGS